MKKLLILFLVVMVAVPAYPQKKRERVKRKYRRVEQVNTELPPVFLWGKVVDHDQNLLPGVSVVLLNSEKGVHTNSEGEFLLNGLTTGKNRIQVSLSGYKTKYTDIELQDGNNEFYFMLDEEKLRVGSEVATTAKREQQTLDIPSAVNVLSGENIQTNDITQAEQIGDWVPGVGFNLTNSLSGTGTIRGITQRLGDLRSPQRLGFYYGEIPLPSVAIASLQLFDLERMEVVRGSQPVAFGSGALAGAIQYQSRKPDEKFGGFVSAGYGNYGWTTAEAALNLPIIKDKILTRFSGFYNSREGYVENSFGGKLNGLGRYGGRFSLLILPNIFNRIDFEAGYQKSDEPGTAFVNPSFPNTFGDTLVSSRRVSLNYGDSLANRREMVYSILNARHYFTEHTYLSSISSFFMGSFYELYDADGTAANAANFSDKINLTQLNQEVRLNYSANSILNGYLGGNYSLRTQKQTTVFSANEQHLYNLFYNPGSLVGSDGLPVPVAEVPDGAELPAETVLPEFIAEQSGWSKTEHLFSGFLEGTYNVASRLRFTAGARADYSMQKYSAENKLLSGGESVLGQAAGTSPNLLYTPIDTSGIKHSGLSFGYFAAATYKFNPDAEMFLRYSSAGSPEFVRFGNDGQPEIVPSERLASYEGGYKGIWKSRLWVGLAGYYSQYSNFRSSTVGGAEGFTGKAVIYGAEADLKFRMVKQAEFFANYSWTRTKIDSLAADGSVLENGGNQLPFSPEHRLSLGLNLSAQVGEGFEVFATPAYLFQTGSYFDEANSADLYQKSYGLLNCRVGFRLPNAGLTFLIYANNLLNENYLLSGVSRTLNQASLTTVVPTPPRMVGARFSWDFKIKEKPYYKRKRR